VGRPVVQSRVCLASLDSTPLSSSESDIPRTKVTRVQIQKLSLPLTIATQRLWRSMSIELQTWSVTRVSHFKTPTGIFLSSFR
jgi:hypothetical protein